MSEQVVIRNILGRIDVQNDFISGSLAVKDGERVVTPLNEVGRAVRKSGGLVFDTMDDHPAVTPHFDTWPVHCVSGTDGAKLHPRLEVQKADILLPKGRGKKDGYSGWEGIGSHGETLETIIAPRSPQERVRIFLGGLATDYCVKATALDIAARFNEDERIELYLLRDAMKAVDMQPDDGNRAVEAMKAAKFFAVSSQEAIRMIRKTA